MTDLLIRVNNVEQQVKLLQDEQHQYVPASVNNLHLDNIRTSVGRIERDVSGMSAQLTDLNNQLAKQRESQANLQIRALWVIVAAFFTVLGGVLINFFTHFIH
jgi:hypothetical protein